MPLSLTTFLTPSNGGDFFLVEDKHLRGGFRTVNNPEELNTIGASCLKTGMLAYSTIEGKFWTYDGSSWAELVLGLPERQTISTTTDVLAPDASENIELSGPSACHVLSISTDQPAWVRMYSSPSRQSSDSSRNITEDPLPGSGVCLEVITSIEVLNQVITPAVTAFNETGTKSMCLTVTNKGLQPSAITVSLLVLELER